MTLGVGCFLRHVFSDRFNAEKSRLKEVQSRNKSAHRIIVGYLGAVYTSIVLGNHPVPVIYGELQRIVFFFLLRVFVKVLRNEKLADDLKDLDFSVSQTKD